MNKIPAWLWIVIAVVSVVPALVVLSLVAGVVSGIASTLGPVWFTSLGVSAVALWAIVRTYRRNKQQLV